MKIPKPVWIGGGVLIAAAAIYLSSQPQPLPVRTATASRGKAVAYVEERGVTSLPSISKITMPFQGRIMPITMEDGTPVKKGDVVAVLDKVDLLNWCQESEQMTEYMAQATEASAASVAIATDQYNYAVWWVDAQKDMFKKQTVSENDFRRAVLDYQTSFNEYHKATRDENSNKALYTLCKLFQIFMERQVRLATLESPADGIVLKRHFTNPVVLEPGTLLLELGDLSKLEVTADILTTQAANIRPGNKAEILDLPVGTLNGEVSRIKHMGFTKVSSLGIEEQRIPVDVAFGQGELGKINAAGIPIGVAWRVRVRITTAEKENVILVPATALIRRPDGSWSLFVDDKGKARAVVVVPGLSNPETVEIASGLEGGEEVILAPPATLADGMPVSRAKPNGG